MQFCKNCGAEMPENTSFCPKCGTKVETNNPNTVNQSNEQSIKNDTPSEVQAVSGAETQNTIDLTEVNQPETTAKKKIKKLPIIICAIAVVLVGATLFSVLALPKMLKSPEDYILEGNYETAYKKSEDSKENIFRENLVVNASKMCKDMLKDKDSFELRDAYISYSSTPISSDDYEIILVAAANNSYGNTVVNYWRFDYSSFTNKMEYNYSHATLEDEPEYSFDTESEKLDKAIANLQRSHISTTINMSSIKGQNTDEKMNKKVIKRVNDFFEDDLIDDIELIDRYDFAD